MNNLFTEEELLSKSLIIDELTWEKDEYSWVTIWYQVTQNGMEPKNACIWKKGTDFVNL